MCLTAAKRNEYLAWLKKRISPHRLQHTLGVEQTAMAMARRYGVDSKKAQIAALLHDCAKTDKPEDPALHGRRGAEMAQKKWGIQDEDIQNAIRWHTVARPKMSDLEMLIYIADMIEPGRDFPGLSALRQAADQSLEEGMLACLAQTVGYLMQKRISVDQNAILAYNDIIKRRRCDHATSIS